MPLVSVVIPVHNGQAHLRETLASVANQTLTDIEVIVVDDASTDGSRVIAEEFVASDPRFRCEDGPGVGSAGAARNLGLDLAKGDYFAFLDADDFFAPTMLQELHEQAIDTESDIVLTKFRTVDHLSGDAVPADWALRLRYFPRRTTFAPSDLGDYLFYAVHPAAWNKLFRAEFIRGRKLRFQELRRTNDLYFSYMALASAKRISIVEGYLIDYRVGNEGSLQGSLHESPLEFTQALEQLSSHLKAAGLFPKLERAFVNEAVEACLNSLRKVGTAQAFAEIHHALRNGVLARLGILGRDADYFLIATLAAQVTAIMELSTEELLFSRLTGATRRAAESAAEARQVLREIDVRANASRLAAGLSSTPARAPRAAPLATRPTPGTSAPDISVVIPVHNTELFLDKCVRSVLTQTGVSFEIICIDDGSTDASNAILEQLAKLDARIQVVRQENAGASMARNRGIELATGRYLCFLDSDDFYQFDGLAALISQADQENLDLLLFDAVSQRGIGVSDQIWERYRDYYTRGSYSGIRTGPEMLAAMRANQDYRVQPCLYVVRGDHLRERGVRFYPGIAHEDNLFTFELMLGAERVAHSQTTIYARTMRQGSLTTAGSRISSARGYLITYLEMLRLAGREQLSEPIATQVASIIFSAFKLAIGNFVKVNTDVGDRLRDVDPSPEAQAAVMLLKHLRYEAQFKRGSAKPAKLASTKPRSFPRRVIGKLRRMARQLRSRVVV